MPTVNRSEQALIRMMTVDGRVHPKEVRQFDLEELSKHDLGRCRLALESVVSCVLRAESDLYDEALECLASLEDKRFLLAVMLYEAQNSESRRVAVHLALDKLNVQLDGKSVDVWRGIREGKRYNWRDVVNACQATDWRAMPLMSDPYLFDSCLRVFENPLPGEIAGTVRKLADGLLSDLNVYPELRRRIVQETRMPEVMAIVEENFRHFVEQVILVLTSRERPWLDGVSDDEGMEWMFDLANMAGRSLSVTIDPAHWANTLADAKDLPWLWTIIHQLMDVSGVDPAKLAGLIHGRMTMDTFWKKEGYPGFPPCLPNERIKLVGERGEVGDILGRMNPGQAVPLLKLLAVEMYSYSGDFWPENNTECVRLLMAQNPDFFRQSLRDIVRNNREVSHKFVLLWCQATGRDEQTSQDLAAWVANQTPDKIVKIPAELLSILLKEGVASTDLLGDEAPILVGGTGPESLLEAGYELKPIDTTEEVRVRRLIPHYRNNEPYPSPIWDNAQWRESILRSGHCVELAVASILLRATEKTGTKYGLSNAQCDQAVDWLIEVLIPECTSKSLQNALWNFAWNPPSGGPSNHPTYNDAEKVVRRLFARNSELEWVRSADMTMVYPYMSANWWSMLYEESEVVRAFLDPRDQVSLLLDNALKDKSMEGLPTLCHFEWLFTTPESRERLKQWLLKNFAEIKPKSWLLWVRTHRLVTFPSAMRRVRDLLNDEDPAIQQLAVSVLRGEVGEDESNEEEE